MKSIFAVAISLCLMFGAMLGAASELPLANTYDQDRHLLSDYYLSEKLDGVRAYWDGKQLLSRNGLPFAAPDWFVIGLPPEPLDGELWGGRNTFEAVSGVVRRHKPHAGWSKLKFMVFELPLGPASFTERYLALRQLEQTFASPYWAVVEQIAAPETTALLENQLKAIIDEDGEGLMLKRKEAAYQAGRSDDLLKVKLWDDAEAVVVEHHQGKGRYAGMLGSMTVVTPEGTSFRIGSGFSDEQRRNPPPIGATVQYKYTGYTNTNKPKFPVFWRIRVDL